MFVSAEEKKRIHAETMRKWRAANPAKAKAIMDRFFANNPDYYKNKARQWRKENPKEFAEQKRRNRIRSYGITPEEYRQMVLSQNGLCAICHAKPRRDLDIDHCHASGKVRGLLCSYCNKALGMFKDSREYLEAAIRYLGGVK